MHTNKMFYKKYKIQISSKNMIKLKRLCIEGRWWKIIN